MSRTERERLADIVERTRAIAAAEEQLLAGEGRGDEALGRTAFDAILYDLVVIGEAVKALPKGTLERHPGVPWDKIAKMRDLLAHHYFKVRGDVVRATIDVPIAQLAEACEEELRREAS